MNRIAGNDVYTIFHFIRKDNAWNFAGFLGVFSTRERAEKALNITHLVKGECDSEYFHDYLSEDGSHKWEINKTMVR